MPSAEVLSNLEVIRRQGNRLARHIENLLDVSRINNNRLRLDREVVDLCDLARECVGQFGDEVRVGGCAMTLEASAPTIGYFDRMRLEQVVCNLLSNAIEYGAGKPVVVRVSATEETAVLEVEDQGVGIAPEDQARVFERFERAASAHGRQSLGLGLYIVRSIVEAHGGTVRLRSEVGKGSTFTVELPRRRLPEQGGAGGAAAESGRRDGDGRHDQHHGR